MTLVITCVIEQPHRYQPDQGQNSAPHEYHDIGRMMIPDDSRNEDTSGKSKAYGSIHDGVEAAFTCSAGQDQGDCK